MSARQRIVAFLAAVAILGGVASPAFAASTDSTTNRLCLDTGYGYYGVSDHAHLETYSSGSYHAKGFAQASAWGYYGTGTYCRATSLTLGCTATVRLYVYDNGSYLVGTGDYSDVGVHSVSTGDYAIQGGGGVYDLISVSTAWFGNDCASSAYGYGVAVLYAA